MEIKGDTRVIRGVLAAPIRLLRAVKGHSCSQQSLCSWNGVRHMVGTWRVSLYNVCRDFRGITWLALLEGRVVLKPERGLHPST